MRNGVKAQANGTTQGVINLLGPRTSGGSYREWDSHFTYVLLRFAFVGTNSGAPLMLGRTFITIFDFDTGLTHSDGSTTQVECVQVNGAASLQTAVASEIVQRAEGTFLAALAAPPSNAMRNTWAAWNHDVFCGSTYGVGADKYRQAAKHSRSARDTFTAATLLTGPYVCVLAQSNRPEPADAAAGQPFATH
jgi:hypothetical protein